MRLGRPPGLFGSTEFPIGAYAASCKPASEVRSRVRLREIRDMTVPIGMPISDAVSAQV